MTIVPVTHAQAKGFVNEHHRHNLASVGAVFNVGLEKDGELIGVAVVGMPKARLLMDGKTLEVTRVCVLEGNKDANSMLYGACARAAKALGWQRLVTYTLTTESGASLRAAGWKCDPEPRDHDTRRWLANGGLGNYDLFGNERIPTGPKWRWWREL